MIKQLMFCVLFLLPQMIVAQDFWQQSNGPYSGSVRQFIFDKANQKYYAAVNSVGIFCSTNKGQTWEKYGVQDYIQSAQTIAINSSGKIFTGTQVHGVMAFNNFGEWEERNTGLPGYDFYVYKIGTTSKGTLLISTYSGEYRSTDEGMTWNYINSGKFSIHYVVSDNGDLYSAESHGPNTSLWKSTDDGISWDTVATLSGEVSKLQLADTLMFILTEDRKFYCSSNMGSSWSLKYEGFQDFSNNSHGVLYGITMNNDVYYSSDWGDQWSLIGPVANADVQSNTHVVLDCLPNDYVFAAPVGHGVYRSTDNGLTWAQSGFNFSEINSLVVNAAGNIFCGTNGSGFYQSQNHGISWRIKKEYINARVLAVNASGDLFAGTWYEGVARSKDNGESWNYVYDGISQPVFSLAIHYSDNYIFAGTQGGKIYRSTDNGYTWSKFEISDSLASIMSIVLYQSTTILAATDNGEIYKSTDNGGSWAIINHNITESSIFYSLHVCNDNTILLGTNNGLYRSFDAGESWSGYRLPDRSVTCFTRNSDGHIFAGTDFYGVYRSDDNGSTWAPVLSGLETKEITSIAMDFDGYVYAGTTNGGVYRSVSVTTSSDEAENNIPLQFSISQNYPNPFNPSTTFKYEIAKTGFVTLKVYDILGRELATLVNEVRQPGLYSTEWNSTGKPSGVYFYRLTAGSFSETKKMILLK